MQLMLLVGASSHSRECECEEEDEEMLVMRITKVPRGNLNPGPVSMISRITEQKLPDEDKIYFIKSKMTKYYHNYKIIQN